MINTDQMNTGKALVVHQPEVGEGATIHLWSDAHAYDVVAISADRRTVHIRRCAVRAKSEPGQWAPVYEYTANPAAPVRELVLRNTRGGAHWYEVSESVRFEAHIVAAAKRDHNGWVAATLTPDQVEAVYGESYQPQHVVPGITRRKRNYRRVYVVFGERAEFHDPSF